MSEYAEYWVTRELKASITNCQLMSRNQFYPQNLASAFQEITDPNEDSWRRPMRMGCSLVGE